jgi:hypothetical protein
MATIDKIDLTTAESLNLLAANANTPIQLTSYVSGQSTFSLSGGNHEDIGGYWYKVNDGNYSVDMTGVSGDGTYYIYITDSGSGSATSVISTTNPLWDSSNNGFYDGSSKATHTVKRVSGSFEEPYRLIDYYVGNTGISTAYFKSFTATITTAARAADITDVAGTGEAPFSQGVKTDTIVEKSSGVGVTIDDVKLKDSKVIAEHLFHSELSTSSVTKGTVYSALESYMPNIGDQIKITGAGQLVTSANNVIFSFATRSSASVITINYCDLTAGTETSTTVSTPDGNVIFTPISIAW